ncbi:MAG: GIY-YIG nuclease family protein [Patescibacteria group bacterium]|nr:GIY-YIG nuclease family protein [Patescibacteria group bacterium]MDD4304129.1 GIY-YIG nuclease family protein [Patescibacteria group bacterium]MDD4695160.1 GIY-YIG nuclease family protein [Patescibacteria group bacterium]
MIFYVYIARCNDETLYTGYCKDLDAREKKHNIGEGAKYTKYRTPIKIIYHEKFDSRVGAMKRERQIKKLPKVEKEDLINRKLK